MNGALDETTFSFSREAPQPSDRRRQPRQFTILRVGTLLVDGNRELCLIRNISAGGLMAHVYSALPEGRKIAVELRTSQSIPGTITWAEDSNIGITFDAPIDVEEMLASQATLDNGWLPRPPRIEVDRMGTLRIGARTYVISTRDISQGGVKLETEAPLSEGDAVVLSLEKFRPLPGLVRWCQAGQAGIAFNAVIPFKELMGWLRAE